MIDNDHARLRRYVTAWTARLARDAEHLQSVRARLQGATVLAADEVPAGLVTLHSVIRVRELDSGRAFVWTVALPTDEEVHTTARSPRSWVGVTLLGTREGDEVEWVSGSRTLRVRIESVLFRPQAARRTPSLTSASNARSMETVPARLRGVEQTAAAAEGKAQYRVAKGRAAVQEAR